MCNELRIIIVMLVVVVIFAVIITYFAFLTIDIPKVENLKQQQRNICASSSRLEWIRMCRRRRRRVRHTPPLR